MSDPTLASELNRADPNDLPDMLRKVALGTLLAIQEYDTGTITAAATVAIPGGALLVQSARVVSSGTAASLGNYLASDSGATPATPVSGSDATPNGVASLAADGSSITFPNTVTRVVIRYIKKPATALTASV